MRMMSMPFSMDLAQKASDHVVGVVLIAQDVLAPEQQLQFCVLHVLADGAQALPGVFVPKKRMHTSKVAPPQHSRE